MDISTVRNQTKTYPEFELDEGKTARELSDGMKVKCNLLFALSHGAEAVILVEPTSGLDLFALGVALLMFGLFNLAFVAGFFKTSHQLGRPFAAYIVVALLVIGIAEPPWHVIGLEVLNAFGFDGLLLQLILLAAGIMCYTALTTLAARSSWRELREDGPVGRRTC